MKVVTCAKILCLVAIGCLAARAARGEEPTGLQYPVKLATHTATRGGPPKQIHLLAQSEGEFEPVAEPETVAEGETVAEPSLIEGVSPWQVADGVPCDSCGDDCGGGCSMGSRGCLGNLWYGGVDYLLFRPRMSQAVAAVRRQETSNTSVTPNTSTVTDTVVEYPFNYNSSFRVFAGYRLLDCGGNFEVAYWRLVNNAQRDRGPGERQHE